VVLVRGDAIDASGPVWGVNLAGARGVSNPTIERGVRLESATFGGSYCRELADQQAGGSLMDSHSTPARDSVSGRERGR
jgi:hypothetical protein